MSRKILIDNILRLILAIFFTKSLFRLLRFQMRLNRITHKPIYQSFPLNRRSKRWNPIFFALKSAKFVKRFGIYKF
jgi:hypothetical protein